MINKGIITFLIPKGSQDSIHAVPSQLFCRFVQRIPSPRFVRVLDAGLVEHGLVVPKPDGIEVLWNRILFPVDVINLTQIVWIIGKLELLGVLNALCQIEQHIVGSIAVDLVGMHPQYVRHGTSGCRCFQHRPEICPRSDVDFDFNPRILLLKLISNFTQARLLLDIPDGKVQRYVFPSRRGTGAACAGCAGGCTCSAAAQYTHCYCKCQN